MINILGGIVLGAILFAALLWSIYQIFAAKGKLRAVHIALALLTIAGMAAITWNFEFTAGMAGVALIVFGLLACLYERRFNKLLPLVQSVFGGLIIFAFVQSIF